MTGASNMFINCPNGDASKVDSFSLFVAWVTVRAATLPFFDLLNESRYIRMSQKFDISCLLFGGSFGIVPDIAAGGLVVLGVKQIGNVFANEINMSSACLSNQ